MEMAELWTGILTVALRRDINLVPYLALRGLLSEAGAVLRRGLKSTGVLTHIWRDPVKVEALDKGSDSREYRRAFRFDSGVGTRFEAFGTSKAASKLYAVFSSFDVHGGSGDQLSRSSITPTEFSCSFINRREPHSEEVRGQFDLLNRGCEMVCLEVLAISADYGTRSTEMTNAIQDLLLLVEASADVRPGMDERVRTLLTELGGNPSE